MVSLELLLELMELNHSADTHLAHLLFTETQTNQTKELNFANALLGFCFIVQVS